MTLTTRRITTPDGIRYIGIATPHNHPHIQEVGTGWCLSRKAAQAEARRLYALALFVFGVTTESEKAA